MSILDPRAVVVPYHRGDLTVDDLMGEVAYIPGVTTAPTTRKQTTRYEEATS